MCFVHLMFSVIVWSNKSNFMSFDVTTGEVFAVVSHMLSLMSKIRSGRSDIVVLSMCMCVCVRLWLTGAGRRSEWICVSVWDTVCVDCVSAVWGGEGTRVSHGDRHGRRLELTKRSLDALSTFYRNQLDSSRRMCAVLPWHCWLDDTKDIQSSP